MMRLLRTILCKLNLGHRLKEKWWPEKSLGMSRMGAILYGCKIRERNGEEEFSYIQCDHCRTIMAPFEVDLRGWSYQEEPLAFE